jgi:hypothetical protein
MRIRTAVAAFAELCLTTRLCDLNIDFTFKIGAKIRPILIFARNRIFIFEIVVFILIQSLQFHQFSIRPALFKERVVRAAFNDLAFVHHDNFVGVLNR